MNKLIETLVKHGPELNILYLYTVDKTNLIDKIYELSYDINISPKIIIETKCEITSAMITYLCTGYDSYSFLHVNSVLNMMHILSKHLFLRVDVRGTNEYFPGHTFCILKSENGEYFVLQSYFNTFKVYKRQFTHDECIKYLNAFLLLNENFDMWETLTGVKLTEREKYMTHVTLHIADVYSTGTDLVVTEEHLRENILTFLEISLYKPVIKQEKVLKLLPNSDIIIYDLIEDITKV